MVVPLSSITAQRGCNSSWCRSSKPSFDSRIPAVGKPWSTFAKKNNLSSPTRTITGSPMDTLHTFLVGLFAWRNDFPYGIPGQWQTCEMLESRHWVGSLGSHQQPGHQCVFLTCHMNVTCCLSKDREWLSIGNHNGSSNNLLQCASVADSSMPSHPQSSMDYRDSWASIH